MAVHKPLIVSAGELRQMPDGDSIFERLTYTLDGGSMLGYGQTLSHLDDFAKTFQVIYVESQLSYPVRLRLYSSEDARDADILRTIYTPPTIQTQHQVIMDLYLNDETGYTWQMSPIACGSTLDGLATIYFTIDNFSPLALHHLLDVTIITFE